MKKNKIFLSIILMTGMVCISFMVMSCKKNNDSFKMNLQDVYSTNIIASVNLLNSSTENNRANLSMGRNNNQRMLLANTNDNNVDFDELAKFVNGMSTIVSDIENKFIVSESDKEEYETKITYQSIGLNQEEQTYIIYYNETKVNEDDDEKDKDEVETTLEGIAIADEKEYKVFGKKEMEKDELEVELEIVFDEKNYVKISQEKENGEIEYEYEIVENGKTINEFEMEFKTKNGKTVVEVEKEINGKKEKLEVKNSENSNKIKIEIEMNNVKTKYFCEYLTKEDGKAYYQFTNIENGEVVEVLA